MIALLLKSYWQYVVIAALALWLVAACHARDNALTERGRALEKVRVADSTLKVLRPALARTDTLLQTRIKTVTQTIARLDTIRDTVLLHLTDTLLVRTFIEKSDSALKGCSDALGTCVLFRIQANATIQALESKVRALPVADRRSCAPTGLVWGLVGAGAGFLGGRVVR